MWVLLSMVRFYKTEADFNSICKKLKMTMCPNCKLRGFLILHGYLYGYSEYSAADRIKRGRRIFCSNRNKKMGCGRTFSFLMAAFIYKFTTSAQTVWRFLNNVKNGMSPAQAARTTGTNMQKTAVYRIYKRFLFHQTRIRTFLMRVKDPPQTKHPDAAVQTLSHLATVFGLSCPISKFQYHFQVSFF
jgi:hypothetical protein